jgi:virginiamycin B lyase
MRVIGSRLCLLACIHVAVVSLAAERMASAKLKNAEPDVKLAPVEKPVKSGLKSGVKSGVKNDTKRVNWPPKLGVKTPGVQIPMSELKAESDIVLPGPIDSLLVGDTIVVAAIKSKDQVVPIQAKTNKPEEPVSGFHQPCGTLVNGFNSVWTPNCKDRTISRFDSKNKKFTASIPLAFVDGNQTIVASSDSIWALSDGKTTLTRVDPEENRIVAETRLPSGCASILFAENALWVSCPKEDKILRIDPSTNLVKKRIEVAGQPTALTYGEGTVWVLTRAEGKIVRIDPKTDKVTATIELKASANEGSLVFGDGFAWASIPGFPIARLDPATDKVMQQFAGEGGGSIYFGAGSVWLPNLKANTLSRFDPKRIKATLAE